VPTVGLAHQATFRYPQHGGIQELVLGYVRHWFNGSTVRTGFRVASVTQADGAWTVRDRHGLEQRCERLISTLPLGVLLDALGDVPGIILDAAAALEWLDVWITPPEPERVHGHTAVYVPGPESDAHRVYYPRAFSEASGSVGFECSEVTARHGEGPARDGIRVEYAYPVQTKKTATARKMVLGYLSKRGIRCVGRTGTHSYLNSDACVRDARALAREIES
jgi:hypothetical protein